MIKNDQQRNKDQQKRSTMINTIQFFMCRSPLISCTLPWTCWMLHVVLLIWGKTLKPWQGKRGGPGKKPNPEVNATLSASHRYSPLLTKCCYGLRIATACNYSRFHSFTSSYTWHYALHLPCTFPYLSPLRDGFSWRCLAQHFCNFSEQLSPSNTREASWYVPVPWRTLHFCSVNCTTSAWD